MLFNVRLEDKWTIWIKSGQCPGCAKNHLIGPLCSLAVGLMFCTLGGGTLMETSKRSQLWLLKSFRTLEGEFSTAVLWNTLTYRWEQNLILAWNSFRMLHETDDVYLSKGWNLLCSALHGACFCEDKYEILDSVYIYMQLSPCALLSICSFSFQGGTIVLSGGFGSKEKRGETKDIKSLHAKPADAY